MKIVFRNLPEGEGTVKVSLDGGNTFIDHQINTIRENGIPLADNQDYSKILIKGSANILKNLDILSSVKVDGGVAQSTGIPYTYEKPVYELGNVTYRCYAYDNNTDGQITDDDDMPNCYHLWVKTIDGNNTVYSINPRGLTTDVSNLVELSELTVPPPSDMLTNITINENLIILGPGRYIRYPEGDLTNEEQTIVGTETVTEVIKFLQDPPTITENGTVIADEGKAFKLANVEVPKSELGFKCFYNYAPEHYFGEVPQAAQALDSGTRTYTILMSNDYLKNLLSSNFPGRTYNGVVGIYNNGNGRGVVSTHYTLDSEYNLFEYYTNVGTDTLLLYFYDSLTSQDSFHTVRVSLIDGSRFEYENM